ncbi:hypothetical protein F2P56_010653 [Juglans regia]|uniref:Uncharacterized protein LOC109011919 n=2 Tax=Juglans regia TaxID=51240 RepID=A0A2I4GYC5_JUGRE|nr:uncharacterized protein LOC109011919 [Juglans regia]KAF5470113.1 hypothetical protein F2P56_010653 [Juglans regia]
MANSSSSMTNPSDASSSPYYLHPSNNPGALLVFENFSGENYVAWSRSIPIALTVKNKTAFIDGSLPQPSPNDTRLQDELKVRYLRNDGPRVFTLEKSLSSISQGSNSITEYFNDFKTLWDEYISYHPLPTCSCGIMETCTCAILKNLTDHQQADYVMKFLIGLQDSYSAIRSQLLLLDWFFLCYCKKKANDLSKWKMIELAKVRTDLYHLINLPVVTKKHLPDSNNFSSTVLANASTTNSDIWDFQLGHLSPTRLQVISSLDSFVKSSHNHVCEICPLARQKKL